MRNGDILCHPDLTDSHEDLIQKYNIRDRYNQLGKFCRIEYIPTDLNKITDFSTWEFIVDEKIKPDWLDEERIKSSLNERVKRMFIDDERKFLLGSCWILLSNAHVEKVKNACIKYMLGESRVLAMHGSSSVEYMRDSSSVFAMHDFSRIKYMRDSSSIGHMYDLSSIGYMRDSSSIITMNDSPRVGCMLGESRVGHMYNSSRVVRMDDSSKVNTMHGSSRAEYMHASSRVDLMYNSTSIGSMYDSSRIEYMCGSSKIEKDKRTERERKHV
jgi:hypothetical protein